MTDLDKFAAKMISILLSEDENREAKAMLLAKEIPDNSFVYLEQEQKSKDQELKSQIQYRLNWFYRGLDELQNAKDNLDFAEKKMKEAATLKYSDIENLF